MKHPSRRHKKHTKKRYRVRTWREYDRALHRRGRLTLWFSEEGIRVWRQRGRRRPGGHVVDAETPIETALTVRLVYRLELRQTEGFLRSICRVFELNLRIPDHSTLNRRALNLGKLRLPRRDVSGQLHLSIDSTGVRVHAGKIAKPPRNRTWRMLHLVVSAMRGEIAAMDLTGRPAHDSRLAPLPLIR